jgi:hypothetical protein
VVSQRITATRLRKRDGARVAKLCAIRSREVILDETAETW